MKLAPVFAAIAALPIAAAADSKRLEPIRHRAELAAPIEQVWHALTTQQGAGTFFAGHALVESRVGGRYEMYFLPENPEGLRGGEGLRILAMEPPNRFLISWNAPPRFGALREQHTVVEFLLTPLAEHRTLITLEHFAWGQSADWQDVREYFVTAWQEILGRLQYRFDHGPIDWQEKPSGLNYFTPVPQAGACTG